MAFYFSLTVKDRLLNHKKTVNTYFNKNVNLHKTIYIFVLFIGDSNE